MRVFLTEDLRELYQTGWNKKYKNVARTPDLIHGFIRAIDEMMAVSNTRELMSLSHLHYEKLKYQYSGYSSVRLSNRHVHRLLFTESEDEIEVRLIKIDDTHYGNK